MSVDQIGVSRSGFATRAVRSGQQRGFEGEHSEPIFATSSYVFESAAEAAARFSEQQSGNIYSRFTNPTVRTFEQRLAALEEGESCVATASGMSAILATCLATLKSGDHIVASASLFGSTVSLFTNYLPRFGIEVTFVELTDPDAWSRAMRPQTRMLFLETPSNPLMEIVDIGEISQISRAAGCMLVVDNCFCTPALQRPLSLGADLVVHSATKYLDGQGRCIGGAVVGDRHRVGKDIFAFLRTAGPSMSPFNAWVFLKGLETLKLRMRAHSDSAMELARWLQSNPLIARVYYPGLDNHPQHRLAARQQDGFGGIVSFEVHGGRQAAWQLIDSTRMVSITANLGDTRTTITHPASTTHGRLSPAQRERAGISESLVRLSVGLEDIEDIKSDLSGGIGA